MQLQAEIFESVYYLRTNPILLRNFLLGIYIHLDKLNPSRSRFFFGQGSENRGYGFAGAAPVGVEVDDCVGGLGEEG